MPQLLQYPADSKVVGQFRRRRPIQDATVILLGSRSDPLSTHGKLTAAHVPDCLGYLVGGHVEDLPIRVGKVGTDVVVFEIGSGRTERVYARRTTGVVLTSQVDVSVSINGLEPDISQRIVGKRTEEIIVPLLRVCMYEDGVIGEVIVEVDDVGEIRR